MVLAGAVAYLTGTGSSPGAPGSLTPPPSSGAAPAATPLSLVGGGSVGPGARPSSGDRCDGHSKAHQDTQAKGDGRKPSSQADPQAGPRPDRQRHVAGQRWRECHGHRQDTYGCPLLPSRWTTAPAPGPRPGSTTRPRTRAARWSWTWRVGLEHDARNVGHLRDLLPVRPREDEAFDLPSPVGPHKDAGPSALLGSQASSVAAGTGWSKAIGGRVRPVNRSASRLARDLVQLGSARLRAVDAAIADPERFACEPKVDGVRGTVCAGSPAREGPPSSGPWRSLNQSGCRPACRVST